MLTACACALLAGSLSCLPGCGSGKLKWTQVAGDGIADRANTELYPGPPIGDKLPVGTFAKEGERAYLYAWDGFNFKQVGIRGFGRENRAIIPRVLYRGFLYIGTVNDFGGGQVWKWNGFGEPEMVGENGLGTSDCNAIPLGVIDGELIVGTGNYQEGRGLSVFSYDGEEWERLVGGEAPGTSSGPGFGDDNNISVVSYGDCGSMPGELLFGVINFHGAQVWSFDGRQFRHVGAAGKDSWSDTKKSAVSCVAGRNEACFGLFDNLEGDGAELWDYDGDSWSRVAADGLADPANSEVFPFHVGNTLYASTSNPSEGAMIYRHDRGKWTEICDPGLGDPANVRVKLAVFEGKLFAFADSSKWANVYMADV